MRGGCVGCRNGLDTRQEAWSTLEMVQTQDWRLGKEQIWSGQRMRGLEGCGNGLDP